MTTKVFTISVAIAIASAMHGAAAPKIPGVALPIDGGKPLWFSASVAMVKGELQPEFFHPAYLDSIKRNRATNGERCVSFISPGPLHIVDGATLEDRVARSYTVVSGEITGAEQGFYAGIPGTLFVLEIAERLKNFGHSPTSDVLYLFVASAELETPHGYICAMPAPGTLVPVVGDRAILFAQLPGQDENAEFVFVNHVSMLILERKGTLLGSVRLRKETARDLDDVRAAIVSSGGLAHMPERPVRP